MADTQVPPPGEPGHANEGSERYARSTAVAGGLLSGLTREQVTRQLVDQHDMARTEAQHLVDTTYADLVRELDAERATMATLPVGVGAGIVAALVGGAVWGAIVYYLGWDIGIFAWAVGLLVGTVMLKATQGRKSRPLQIVAAVCAVLGVVFARYAIVYMSFRDQASSALDPDIARTLIDNAGEFFDLFTLIFTGLAVLTAYRMLEPTHTDLVRDDDIVVAPAIR
jgi:hypothetical protein